jgi:hypothetical protein
MNSGVNHGLAAAARRLAADHSGLSDTQYSPSWANKSIRCSKFIKTALYLLDRKGKFNHSLIFKKYGY